MINKKKWLRLKIYIIKTAVKKHKGHAYEIAL